MYFSVQLSYVVLNYNFKTISVEEMEPNFVRMKVPEFKKYLKSVSRISASRRTFGFFGKSYSCTNLPLSLLLFRRLLNQFGPRPASTYTNCQQGVLAPSKVEYSSFKPVNVSFLFIFFVCFWTFLEIDSFLLLEVCGVSFHCFRRLSSGSVRLFGGFC